MTVRTNPQNASELRLSKFNWKDYRVMMSFAVMHIIEEYCNSTMPTYMLLERIGHAGNWVIRCVQRVYEYTIPSRDLKTPEEDDSYI